VLPLAGGWAACGVGAGWGPGAGAPKRTEASICCIRAISVVWSTFTSLANLNTVSSWPAPQEENSCWTIWVAPVWCWIMKVRNSRSNSAPRARSSSAICAGVSIPGISISCCMPPMFMGSMAMGASGSGTGWPRSRSQFRIVAISSCCALMMREASVWICGLAPWVGAMRDMTMACAWCPIMCDMKSTSACVQRAVSGRAAGGAS
jgi:hypothetical protein